MSSVANRRYTPEEYLALERKADHKSEYYRGEIFAMAGASRRHNVIVWNCLGSLHQQLRGRRCEAYASDMRVRVTPTGLYTYPDVIVVCGKPEFLDDREDTLLNPTVLIEVLSPSTEDYDRGKKFEHYSKLESLQEYVVVAQAHPYAARWTRQTDGRWLLQMYSNLADVVELPSIDCQLALADVYDKVEFDPDEPLPTEPRAE